MDNATGYARLVSWSVENFMSIQKATCEFDDRNIINLKGYNDSGKSAMLRALDVLFYNMRPNAQVNFINDNADYFRIVAKFSDGVVILRDKYSNGQSLYEMYKDDELLYSTKVQGVLSKVSTVPEPIQAYLGMIEYEGTLLNSRTCFEKQLLVQTSGGDNYKLLNAVLKSEELATASKLLNEDKNKMGVEINKMTSSVDTYKEFLAQTDGLTEDIVHSVEVLDSSIDNGTEQLNAVEALHGVDTEIESIVIHPEISTIDSDKSYETLMNLVALNESLNAKQITPEIPSICDEQYALINTLIANQNALISLDIPPRVDEVDQTRYDEIRAIYEVKNKVDSIPVFDEIDSIDTQRLDMLSQLSLVAAEYQECIQQMEKIESDGVELKEQVDSLVEKVGGNYMQCPNCGEIIEVTTV